MSSAGEEMAQQKSPEQLREEIEQTREELGETVELLAAKTDIKAQARARVQAVKDGLDHRPGSQQLATLVTRHPLPTAALGGFSAGLLTGWLLTRH